MVTRLSGNRITKDKTTIERTENSSMSTVRSVANASGRRHAKGDSAQRNAAFIGIAKGRSQAHQDARRSGMMIVSARQQSSEK